MIKIGGWLRSNTATIGVLIIMVAMGSILFVQALALNKLETEIVQQQRIITQVKDLATSLDAHANERTGQINQLNRHMDCIVVFFSQPDHASRSISDIDSCTFTDTATGRTYPNLLEENHVFMAPTPSSQPAPKNTSTGPAPQPSPTGTRPKAQAAPSSPAVPSSPSFIDKYFVNPLKSLVN